MMTGEVLHNLRSALDHLADALVRANGGTPTEYTAFPISTTGLTRTGNPKNINVDGGVSPQALALIQCLQPYQPGGQGTDASSSRMMSRATSRCPLSGS